MCIALFTTSHPGYKLILASNRDEFHDRPASTAAWHNWDRDAAGGSARHVHGQNRGVGAGVDGDGDSDSDDDGDVLSGIDLSTEGGGTWLGMTRDMRVAVLTNIRPPNTTTPLPRPPGAPSRGGLLRSFLTPRGAPPTTPTTTTTTTATATATTSLDDYLASQSIADMSAYDGFNMLLFQPTRAARAAGSGADARAQAHAQVSDRAEMQVAYLTNRHSPCATTLALEPGTHGLSNTVWAEPWPKVVEGCAKLAELLIEWEAERGASALASASDGSSPRAGASAGAAPPDEVGADEDALVHKLFALLHGSIDVRTPADAPLSIRIPTLHYAGRAYGTRTSTVILISHTDRVVFIERTLAPGEPREVRYVFQGQEQARDSDMA